MQFLPVLGRHPPVRRPSSTRRLSGPTVRPPNVSGRLAKQIVRASVTGADPFGGELGLALDINCDDPAIREVHQRPSPPDSSISNRAELLICAESHCRLGRTETHADSALTTQTARAELTVVAAVNHIQINEYLYQATTPSIRLLVDLPKPVCPTWRPPLPSARRGPDGGEAARRVAQAGRRNQGSASAPRGHAPL
jgi:hypothetical protein